MFPGEHPPVDGTEEQSSPSEGIAPLKSAEEILWTRDIVSGGNAIPTDLISTQPLPAASPPAEASEEAAEFEKPRCDLQKPTCPRCGLTVPDRHPPDASPALSRPQGSGVSVHSSRRGRSSAAASHQPTATDSCVGLLLACLWCQGSVLLLGLLEACSSCLHTLCSSSSCSSCCCHAGARCCSAVQEAPVEELSCPVHCHSVLFESCCEPTECLEFCLECCEICHRS